MTPILSPVILIAVALGFAALLFAVAARVEHWPEQRIARWRPAAFALALGVYCTSWTFYGAVGSARRDGWDYLPIYLGPILVFALAPRFLRALVTAVQAEGRPASPISSARGSARAAGLPPWSLSRRCWASFPMSRFSYVRWGWPSRS
ncbi:hypothetical protein P0F65_09190 [Sphingomonas sp. I4]